MQLILSAIALLYVNSSVLAAGKIISKPQSSGPL